MYAFHASLMDFASHASVERLDIKPTPASSLGAGSLTTLYYE